MDESNFHQEYRIAHDHTRKDLFSDILSQHAVIMVDGANLENDAIDYVRLGQRLNQVQAHWINLLCSGLNNTVQSELDKQYRRVVTSIIMKFTNRLLDMLLKQQHVTVEELLNAGDFHAHVSLHCQQNLKQTKLLFLAYISSMKNMYNTKTLSAYHRASMACLASAQSLGFWLDNSVFR